MEILHKNDRHTEDNYFLGRKAEHLRYLSLAGGLQVVPATHPMLRTNLHSAVPSIPIPSSILAGFCLLCSPQILMQSFLSGSAQVTCALPCHVQSNVKKFSESEQGCILGKIHNPPEPCL